MSWRVHVAEPGPIGITGYGRVISWEPPRALVVMDSGEQFTVLGQFIEDAEKHAERDAMRREARKEALLDAGPTLAEHNRLKGE